jgi:pimeloyl-ACP methyl ester carboxylesterase
MSGLPPLVMEDLRVAHEAGIEIYVRNVRPQGVTKFSADRIVILQHGATYSSTAFHVPFAGLSWMDYLAQRGFDAYCLDLPGYGRSTRPASMEAPALDNPPYLRTSDAVRALASVVDHVRRRRAVDRLNLIGWSWGTSITACYAAENPDVVARLSLFAPVWDRRNSPSPIALDGPLGAYRTVSRKDAFDRKMAGVPEDRREKISPPGWFEQWADATFAADPKGANSEGRGETLRAPNGVLLDGREYWSVGKALYDPARIMAPTLLAVGEWDRDTPPFMAQAIFPLLTRAAWKRLTVLSEGTHSMVMEGNRMLLFRTVQQFLEEAPPGPEAMM